jgi:hypothetical protein
MRPFKKRQAIPIRTRGQASKVRSRPVRNSIQFADGFAGSPVYADLPKVVVS